MPIPTIEDYSQTLDEIMKSWPGARELPAFAPLEQPARTLFGGDGSETGGNAAALFDLNNMGSLLAGMLQVHPFLTGEDPSRTFGALFGTTNAEWGEIQAPFAFTGIMTAALITLADPGMPKEIADLAVRIGFGLDPYNSLLRRRLVGTYGGLRDPIRMGFDFPNDLHTFEDIFNRTCLLGIRDAAIAGLGFALLPEFAVTEALAARTLRRVLPSVELRPATVHALYRAEMRGSPRLQALIAHLRATVPLNPRADVVPRRAGASRRRS